MKTNFLRHCWLAIFAIILIAASGCASGSGKVRNRGLLRVEISGTESAPFRMTYAFRNWNGSVATVASTRFSPVLEVPARGSGTITVEKREPSQELVVDVYEAGRKAIRVILPTGVKTIRAVRAGSSWHAEVL